MTIMRDEIRQLCAEHDRLMAEHHEWMARREVAGAAPLQKSDESAVLYREYHDNAPAAAPQPAPDASNADAGMLAKQLGIIIAEITAERDAALSLRDERIGKLETQVETLLTLMARRAAQTADIVELPKNFLRRRNDAA